MLRSRKLITAVSAVACLALAACGSSSQPSGHSGSGGSGGAASTLDQLVANAKHESSLTFYGAPNEQIDKRIADAFQKKYGIKTSYISIVSAQLAQRFDSEADAHAVVADVVLSGGNAFFSANVANGNLVDLAKAGIPDYPGDFPQTLLTMNGQMPIVQLQPWTIAYNTDKVKKADLPTLDDLVDPQWKGKIIVPDPSASDDYIGFWDALYEAKGAAYLQKLGGQNLKFEASAAPAIQSVGAAEGSVVIPAPPAAVAAARGSGAPVDSYVPEVTTAIQIGAGLSSHAPHPNAARLFMQYITSTEGSKVLNDGAGLLAPRDATGVKGLSTAPTFTDDRKTEILKLLKSH